MTVQDTGFQQYTGTGSLAVYSFNFRILQAADLVVEIQNTDGVTTTLVADVGYTLTTAPNLYSGGSITLLGGSLPSGYLLTMYRNPANTQLTSFAELGPFPAAAFEAALDKLTMEQQAADLVRSIQFPISDPAGLTNILPGAEGRANTTMGFDSSGNVLVGAVVTGALISAAMLPVVEAATLTAAAAAFGVQQQVLNVAALRTTTTPTANGILIATAGYHTVGDQGQGIYAWNSTDSRADNGGTVISTGLGSGRWNLLYNGWYTVKQFGAKGDGATDDLVAINAAIAAANALGGEVVFFPPSTYIHSAAITMAANVTLLGAGRIASVLKSSHTGDGITMTSPINSSTAVNTVVRDIGLWNTNVSNLGAGYDDVGGTFVTITNVRVLGFKYGIIFDQTELADIVRCDLETNLLAGIWLVNGSEHTGGASTGFTNRIGIKECQINEGTSAWGIIDDGGTSHEVYDNNFNGCLTHVRIAGTQNFHMYDNECESAASVCVYQTNLGIGGGSKGASINSLFVCNSFVPVAGQSCVSLVNGSPTTFIQNLFGNTSAVKVLGVANCFNASFIDNFNAGGGATYSSTATHQFTQDSSGTTIAAGGVGTAIKAHISATGALSFGVPGAVPGAVDLSITVTGAALGDTCVLAPGVAIPSNYQLTAWVDSANTVKARLMQFAGAAAAQDLGTCRADVWKH